MAADDSRLEASAPVIELLGVALRSAHGGWLLRRICVRLEAGELTFVVSADREARLALLDIIAARRIPIEGRAWLSGQPVTHETARGIAARVGDVQLQAGFFEQQSVLATLVSQPSWGRRVLYTLLGMRRAEARALALRTLQAIGLGTYAYERVSRLDEWRRRRLSVARAMIPLPEHLVAREIDDRLSLAQAADLLGVLRTLARSHRLPIIVTAADPTLVHLFADRVLILSEGTLIVDGPPGSGHGAWPTPSKLLQAS